MGLSFYRADQIRQLSVRSITNPVIFDDLNRPTAGGLYDLAMGPIEPRERCQTCGQPDLDCPGHPGHIELALPIFNPLAFRSALSLLKICCFHCGDLLLGPLEIAIFQAKYQLLKAGLIDAYNGMDEFVAGLLEGNGSVQASSTIDAANSNSQLNSHLVAVPSNRSATPGPSQAAIPSRPSAQTVMESIANYLNEHFQKHAKQQQESSTSCSTLSTASSLIVSLHQQLTKKLLTCKTGSRRCANCGMVANRLLAQESIRLVQSRQRASARNAAAAAASAASANRAVLLDVPGVGSLPSSSSASSANSSPLSLVSPLKAKSLLELVWSKRGHFLDLVYSCNSLSEDSSSSSASSAEMFFLSVLPVAPNRFRPVNVLGDAVFEHPQNVYLGEVLRLNARLRELLQSLSTPDSANSASKGKTAPSSTSLSSAQLTTQLTELGSAELLAAAALP